MKKGTYVRLVKLRAAPYGLPACPAPFYSPGAWEDGILSLPVDYWMEGVLERDIKKLYRIHLDRFVRDGVVARGRFVSSPVCSIRGSEVETHNSVYLVMKVPPLELEDPATGNCTR